MKPKQITIRVKVIEPSNLGNSTRRIVLDEWFHDADDTSICAHGERLRWKCDYCDELLKEIKP